MPKALEEKLMKEARAKGLSGSRVGAYVYGTLRKTGWKPSQEMKRSAHGSGQFSGPEICQGYRRME